MLQTEEQVEFLTAEEAKAISQHSELLNILHKVKLKALQGLTELEIQRFDKLQDKTKIDLTELGYKFIKADKTIFITWNYEEEIKKKA